MKKLLLKCALVTMLAGMAGCANLSGNAADAAVAPRAGEALVQALVGNDAEAFLAQFPKEASSEFDANGFRQTRESMVKQIGEPTGYEFLVNLAHPRFTLSVWLIHCERKSSDGQSTIRQDALFRVVSGKTPEGKEQLLQFQFL